MPAYGRRWAQAVLLSVAKNADVNGKGAEHDARAGVIALNVNVGDVGPMWAHGVRIEAWRLQAVPREKG